MKVILKTKKFVSHIYVQIISLYALNVDIKDDIESIIIFPRNVSFWEYYVFVSNAAAASRVTISLSAR